MSRRPPLPETPARAASAPSRLALVLRAGQVVASAASAASVASVAPTPSSTIGALAPKTLRSNVNVDALQAGFARMGLETGVGYGETYKEMIERAIKDGQYKWTIRYSSTKISDMTEIQKKEIKDTLTTLTNDLKGMEEPTFNQNPQDFYNYKKMVFEKNILSFMQTNIDYYEEERKQENQNQPPASAQDQDEMIFISGVGYIKRRDLNQYDRKGVFGYNGLPGMNKGIEALKVTLRGKRGF